MMDRMDETITIVQQSEDEMKIKDEPLDFSDHEMDRYSTHHNESNSPRRSHDQSPKRRSSYDQDCFDYFNEKDLPSSGITVSEYLVNNYKSKNMKHVAFHKKTMLSKDVDLKIQPPTLPTRNIDKFSDAVTMVPLSSSSLLKDSTLHNENINHLSAIHKEENLNMDLEELKKARRREKNKISAQESRKRKKEYVDALEAKLKQGDQEKNLLKDKVMELEGKIRSLVDQLFELKHSNISHHHSSEELTQHQIQYKSTTSRATQTGVCLLCYFKETGHSSRDIETNYEHHMSPCPSASRSSPHSQTTSSAQTFTISDSTLDHDSTLDRDSIEEENEDIDIESAESDRPSSLRSEPIRHNITYSKTDFSNNTPPRLLQRSHSAFNQVSSHRASRYAPYPIQSDFSMFRDSYPTESHRERRVYSFSGEYQHQRTTMENADLSPRHRLESTSPRHRLESTSPRHRLESTSPRHRLESTSPRYRVESTSPRHRLESTSPRYRVESNNSAQTSFVDNNRGYQSQ